MTPFIHGETAVGELVGRYSRTRKVFEQHGIDYCCGGSVTLAEAARAKQVEIGDLIAALQAALEGPANTTAIEDANWQAAPLHELIEHIVRVHHGYLKKALPMLSEMLQKVLRAHAAHHGPMLRQLQAVFSELEAELSGHLMKEEEILFPYIAAAEAHRRGEAAKPSACFLSVGNPIRQMEAEHQSAGRALEQIHAITNGYAPPADACPTFQALYEELRHLEQDLHQHIHLENNILFPRAIRGEPAPAAGPLKLGSIRPA